MQSVSSQAEKLFITPLSASCENAFIDCGGCDVRVWSALRDVIGTTAARYHVIYDVNRNLFALNGPQSPAIDWVT